MTEELFYCERGNTLARTGIIKVEHIAVIVEDIDAALDFWQDGLGIDVAGIKDVPTEGARVAFLPLGDSEIELVQPTATDTGMTRYLSKRGPGLHHICLEVENIEGILEALKAKGVRLINQTPRVEQDGKKYAFIHPESAQGVLVELYEFPEDA